ncbi:MAG: lysophospholipid acyltransferase family protein [Sphaerospermopsis sp. SIO1G2]|nr:lysophospholipid acyltransferase family protein [Sphaerospermopsis sp. SIO1G2]
MKQSSWRWYDIPIVGILWLIGGIITLVPQVWVVHMGRILGDALCLIGYRRHIIEDNLRCAGFGGSSSLVRANYRHYATYLVEIFRLRRLRRSEWIRQNIRFHGLNHFIDARKRNKGVLVLTAHLGNYDILACAGAAVGWPLSIVSKPVGLRSVEWIWMQQRGDSGLNILPNQGSLRDILSVIRNNEILGFILDQHARNGVVVPFFDRPAKTLDSLAILAERTKAPVLQVFTYRDNAGKHHVDISPAMAPSAHLNRKDRVIDMTRSYTLAIENAIRRHPDQWTWAHRRWKVDTAN